MITPVNLSASDSVDTLHRLLDDNLTTRWTSNVVGVELMLEYDDDYFFDHLDIAFYKGNERVSSFELHASLDGENWNLLGNYSSLEGSDQLESYAFTSQQLRFIKLIGKGNSATNWTTISQIKSYESVVVEPVPPVLEDAHFNIDENSDAGVLGSMVASNAVAFEIISGNEDGYFSIDDTGVVYVNESLDFEIQSQYILGVRAWNGEEDPLSADAQLTIEVNDVYEGPNMSWGILKDVSSSEWTEMTFPTGYKSPVIVATPMYPYNREKGAVTRIRNITNRGFEIKLDRVDGNTGEILLDVSISVVEEGVYTENVDGAKMEAAQFLSERADRKNNWVGSKVDYQQSYESPVVFGQVMSYNNERWSAFWSRGANFRLPADAKNFYIGKHVGEDFVIERLSETLGYYVMEESTGVLSHSGIAYRAGVGPQTVRGVDNDIEGYFYETSGLDEVLSGVLSSAGMTGNDGGFPAFYGHYPIERNQINIVVDEDQMTDQETAHNLESLSFMVLGEGVSAGNNPPEAVDDHVEIDEGTSALIDVLANDSDADGDRIYITAVSSPANGTATKSGSSIIYQPADGFSGDDQFTYTISDGVDSSTATVFVSVKAINLPPVATPVTGVKVDAGQEVLIDVMANDYDPNGDVISIYAYSQPANGSVELVDEQLLYRPRLGFTGVDTFTYQITDGEYVVPSSVTVAVSQEGNQAPEATGLSYDIGLGVEYISPVSVLDNDFDADGDELYAYLTRQAEYGTVHLDEDGYFVYVPDGEREGIDTFEYIAFDGSLASNPVTVTLHSDGDNPTGRLTRYYWDGIPGWKIEDLTGHVDYPDYPSWSDYLSSFETEPDHADHYGQRICGYVHPPVDGEYTFYLAASNEAYLWLSTDRSEENIENIAYSMKKEWPGVASVKVNLSAAEAYYIEVLHKENTTAEYLQVSWTGPGIDTPEVISSEYLSHIELPFFDELVDSDVDFVYGDSSNVLEGNVVGENQLVNAWVELVAGPSKGTLMLNKDGSYRYSPYPDAEGTDSFSYRITDGIRTRGPITVSIKLSYQAGPPILVDATMATLEGQEKSIDLAAENTLAASDVLALDILSGPANGSLENVGNGLVIYQPDLGYVGSDIFTYSITTSGGTSEVATVKVSIFRNETLSGGLTYEVLAGYDGNMADLIELPEVGEISHVYGDYVSPEHDGSPAGVRLYGYIQVPSDGFYRFTQEGSLKPRLFVSTDMDPANAVEVNRSGNIKESLYLEAGKRYYTIMYYVITAPDQFVSISWETLGIGDILQPETIGSEYLSCFESNAPMQIKDQSYAVLQGRAFSLTSEAMKALVVHQPEQELSFELAEDVSLGNLHFSSDGSFSYSSDVAGETEFSFTVSDGINMTATGTVKLSVNEQNPNVVVKSWANELAGADLVASAEAVGMYAVASRESGQLEIRDIRGAVQREVTSEQIRVLMPWADLRGNDFGINSMAFSMSGRLLYIGICANEESSLGNANEKDAILRFNYNTNELTLFARTNFAADANTKLEMQHYFGELYVGTSEGINVYSAHSSDKSVTVPSRRYPFGGQAVQRCSISLDSHGEKLYAVVNDSLYQLDVAVDFELNYEGVATYLHKPDGEFKYLADIADVDSMSFARSYGGEGNDGLYLLQNQGAGNSMLYHVSKDDLKAGESIALNPYYIFENEGVTSISATACGRLFVGGEQAMMVSDSRDQRLGFEDWLLEQFKSEINALKAQMSPNTAGMRDWNTCFAYNDFKQFNRDGLSIASKFVLADIILGDPDAEQIVEEIICRYAGNLDGYDRPVETNVDGLACKSYDEYTGDAAQYATTLMIKFTISAATSALNHYGDTNPRIKEACEQILKRSFYRLGDYFSVPMHMDKPCYPYGPDPDVRQIEWSGEHTPAWEFVAAQDVYATDRIMDVISAPEKVREGSTLTYKGVAETFYQYIEDEPAVDTNSNHYDLFFHYDYTTRMYTDPAWKQHFYNLVFSLSAWVDDHKLPYLAGFSFGDAPSMPEKGFINTEGTFVSRITRPRMDVTELSRCMTYSIMGDTWPAVGVYLGYREGLMVRGHTRAGWDGKSYEYSMFDRWSRLVPDWIPNGRIFDRFGPLGSAELIKPGTLLSGSYLGSYIRETSVSQNEQGQDVVDFSQITPRRVLASDDGGESWVSYGFQYAPFTLSNGKQHGDYQIVDPEGQHLMTVMENVDFESGNLDGWVSSGAADFQLVSGAQSVISGDYSVSVSSAAGSSMLTQTIDLGEDFANTRYIVRGNVIGDGSSSSLDRALMVARWDDNADPADGVLMTVESDKVDLASGLHEFQLGLEKGPAQARYLHLSFAVEGAESSTGSFTFDNLSLIRLGAVVESGDDLGLESGTFDSWTSADGFSQFNLTDDPALVKDGNYALLVETTPSSGNKSEMSQVLDISADPIGTRYIFKLNIDAVNQTNTDVTLYTTMRGEGMNYKLSQMIVEPYHKDKEYTFTMRKVSEAATELELLFESKLLKLEGAENDQIVIDKIEIFKEPSWPTAQGWRNMTHTK
ncbi:Ig-like domain-containing protein [Persicirhabdus sediminis]|uniref:Tandem-95 repeat protein n=1 Tax=Persicirhabdus sediminis TaxID=454144 RepID=A0A8J7SKN3_9BACT|nr:Ig-like domain-containing protein [Persicirhabdus sediminis]MBK1792209.1 tandem-95 repeat protein [Persicirhabdus sediminis]